MKGLCEWCQESSDALVPVVNRDVTNPFELMFLCGSCKEVEHSEHADELLWSPVDFASLTAGRLRSVAA